MTDTWTWATVTQASPLRIKVDGDTTALDATTDDLVGSLAVDDRVRVHLHADGIIVTGLQGGAGDGQLPGRLQTSGPDISGQNLNNYWESGWYRGSGVTNAPTASWYHIQVFSHGSSWVVQFATRLHANLQYYRRNEGGTWQPWVEIAAYESDTGWVDINFRSGYAEYSSSTTYTCQMRRMNGVVYTRGLMKASSGDIPANSSITVADMPTGYGFEPDYSIFSASGSTNGSYPATVVYTAGGAVEIRTGGETLPYLGFGGHSWPAA